MGHPVCTQQWCSIINHSGGMGFSQFTEDIPECCQLWTRAGSRCCTCRRTSCRARARCSTTTGTPCSPRCRRRSSWRAPRQSRDRIRRCRRRRRRYGIWEASSWSTSSLEAVSTFRKLDFLAVVATAEVVGVVDLAALVATVAIVAVAASVAFGDFVALMAVVAFVAFEVAEAAEGAPVTEYLRCNGWARNTPHLVLAPMPEVQYFPLAFAWSQLQVFDTP